MSLSPQIALTITLKDFSGGEIGSVSSPAYVRVALCNFGQFLPRIAGTTMIGDVASWPGDITYEGAPISLLLWGNDVITPAGTYYAISILDADKNVLQTAAYVFNGVITADLSTLSPMFPSYSPTVMGGSVIIPPSATPEFNCDLVNGPITFDFTLTQNVTSSTLLAPFPGQIVNFIIAQNGTGGFTFVWPTNVLGPGTIAPGANAITIQSFVARADGNLYPLYPAATVLTALFASATVAFSATPTFTVTAQVQLFKMILTGNVTSSTLVLGGLTAPGLVVFEITQDGTGGRTFAWPANVLGGAAINSGANETTSQQFYFDGTNLIAVSGGIVTP